jgi:hypothetical protein
VGPSLAITALSVTDSLCSRLLRGATHAEANLPDRTPLPNGKRCALPCGGNASRAQTGSFVECRASE